MTPDQISLVQSSWQKVLPMKETAAQLFYDNLFQLDPSLRKLFARDMSEQRRKLMSMLDTAVRGLKSPDALLPAVRELGRRHASYGVQGKDYNTVAMALLATLEKGLGPEFTPETRRAWTAAYTLLAGTMQEQ